MLRHFRIAAVAAALLAAAGCGIKGPLVLPPPAAPPAATPAPVGDAGRQRRQSRESRASDSRAQALSAFVHRDGELCAERVPLSHIAAQFGTPCYVYSRAALESAWREFDAAFSGIPHLVCYAMKANSEPRRARPLRAPRQRLRHRVRRRVGARSRGGRRSRQGRVFRRRQDPKRKWRRRSLPASSASTSSPRPSSPGSTPSPAALAGVAPVSFRVNPDVDPQTHPYISTGLKESKFGIAFADALSLYRRAASLPNIAVRGIDIHIGSQITELEPYREAAGKVLELVDSLSARGHPARAYRSRRRPGNSLSR